MSPTCRHYGETNAILSRECSLGVCQAITGTPVDGILQTRVVSWLAESELGLWR